MRFGDGVDKSSRATPRQIREWLDAMEFSQDQREFDGLLKYVANARSVLEIGSRFGASLHRMAAALKAPGRIVSVDLPHADDVRILDSETPLLERCAEIEKMGHDMHVFLGDSHEQAVIDAVRALGPFDFCFIDGDHSEEGVRSDWKNYGPFCKVVAFHDICGQEGCVALWNELIKQHPAVQFTQSGWLGIGIIFREFHVA